MTKHTFSEVIEDAGSGGAFVTIPFDVEAAFGQKLVKVKALIAGELYRGSLVRMGGTCHILGIRKEIRQKIGLTIGDIVTIELEADTEPREVVVPADLQEALAADPAAGTIFARLAYSHQKEYVEWIETARQAQTRQGRITQTLERLKNG